MIISTGFSNGGLQGRIAEKGLLLHFYGFAHTRHQVLPEPNKQSVKNVRECCGKEVENYYMQCHTYIFKCREDRFHEQKVTVLEPVDSSCHNLHLALAWKAGMTRLILKSREKCTLASPPWDVD